MKKWFLLFGRGSKTQRFISFFLLFALFFVFWLCDKKKSCFVFCSLLFCCRWSLIFELTKRERRSDQKNFKSPNKVRTLFFWHCPKTIADKKLWPSFFYLSQWRDKQIKKVKVRKETFNKRNATNKQKKRTKKTLFECWKGLLLLCLVFQSKVLFFLDFVLFFCRRLRAAWSFK